MTDTTTPHRTAANDDAPGTHEGDRLAVRDLKTAELFTLWAIRQWVHDLKQGVKSQTTLIDGFTRARAQRAFVPLDTLMGVTAQSGTRNLDVRCLRCGGVGDGEIDILATISMAQIGRSDLVALRLSTWLPAAATRFAVQCIDEIKAGLADGGLEIRPRFEYLQMPSELAPASMSTLDDLGRMPSHASHQTVQ